MDSNFKPNGMVGDHPNVKMCKSIVNLMAKLLLYHELGETCAPQRPARLRDNSDAGARRARLRCGGSGFTIAPDHHRSPHLDRGQLLAPNAAPTSSSAVVPGA